VVNHPDYRGQGLGRQLFALAMQRCYECYGAVPLRISAQTYLEEFYQSFGFVSTDDRYLEDGLPHVEMFFPVEHWPEALLRISQGAWLPSLI
jgi:ElaA protein